MRRLRAAVDASILEGTQCNSLEDSDPDSDSLLSSSNPYGLPDLTSPVRSEIAHGTEIDAEIKRTTQTLKDIRKETLRLSRNYELERENIEVEIRALRRHMGPGGLALGVIRQTETYQPQ